MGTLVKLDTLTKGTTNEPRHEKKPVFGVCDQGRLKAACAAT